MVSQVDIANRSLLAVGARTTISGASISDGSVEGNAVSVLWQPTFEQLARSAHWNCLTRQILLSLIQAAQGTPENPLGTTLPLPDSPYLYGYALPADCLDVRFIVPSLPTSVAGTIPATTLNNSSMTWLPAGGQIPYEVRSDLDANGNPIVVILTNQSQAMMVYTVNQSNPQLWDSLFQAAMVASLGAFLVPALSLSLPLMQLAIKQAEMAIAVARTADGREGVTTLDHVPDWMHARSGGQGFGVGYSISTYGGFVNVQWPLQ